MKKYFVVICLALSVFTQICHAQKFKIFSTAFYNLENLFDTIHDNGKNDYEYLPDGTNHWGTVKYTNKLKNMAQVLSKLGTEMKSTSGKYIQVCKSPAIIGVSEVENRNVLEDLLKEPVLKDKGWQILHIEGPDRRGVDCAFFYDPTQFHLTNCHLTKYIYENGDTTRTTRGFLLASGTIEGEEFHFIVNHWPSRAATSIYREYGGRQVKLMVDSIRQINPEAKIVIMGDLNDDPKNKSITEGLKAKHDIRSCGDMDLYNPWWDTLYKVGQGTLLYDGKWNLFDQIIVSSNTLNLNGQKDFSKIKYYRNEIYLRDFLMQSEGKNKGAPKRTHASGVWQNGYSDHLPTQMFFRKDVE
ncbi:MAG: endonuclease/exonuclease/phosphatase family protein [Bacteroidaceae bacterium]|nr:endonuclease/exonuclease/phosphatase family protein [Bacteroidaceae bacterium]